MINQRNLICGNIPVDHHTFAMSKVAKDMTPTAKYKSGLEKMLHENVKLRRANDHGFNADAANYPGTEFVNSASPNPLRGNHLYETIEDSKYPFITLLQGKSLLPHSGITEDKSAVLQIQKKELAKEPNYDLVDVNQLAHNGVVNRRHGPVVQEKFRLFDPQPFNLSPP